MAELEFIVQSVAVTVEFPLAENTPPRLAAFPLIVQFVAMMAALRAKMAAPSIAWFADMRTDLRRSSLPGLI
jgi:hypothetical protein